MYLGKNVVNIDIHHHKKQLTTTMKSFINGVLDSNIANDHCGAQKILLDNRYDFPEIFVILFEEINFIGGGTCRKNIIGFPEND